MKALVEESANYLLMGEGRGEDSEFLDGNFSYNLYERLTGKIKEVVSVRNLFNVHEE